MSTKVRPLKLASLNIEKFAHIDKIIPALLEGDFDILCLQEVPEDLLYILQTTLGAKVFFSPMSRIPKPAPDLNNSFVCGLALLVRDVEFLGFNSFCYRQQSKGIPLCKEKPYRSNHFVQSVVVKKDEGEYRIGHTHFTWSANGLPTPEQGAAIQEMLRLCRQYPDLVLCGDFNMPRGGMLWDLMADVYKDNILSNETSTLDEELHRAAPLSLVVDGLFTTPHYTVSLIEILAGISDHKLISAEIIRVS